MCTLVQNRSVGTPLLKCVGLPVARKTTELSSVMLVLARTFMAKCAPLPKEPFCAILCHMLTIARRPSNDHDHFGLLTAFSRSTQGFFTRGYGRFGKRLSAHVRAFMPKT